MKQSLSLFLALVLVVLIANVGTLATQTRGGLTGSVTAESGQALPGVTVTLSGSGIADRVAVSNPDGTFRFLGLPAGDYTVKAQLEGFVTIEQKVSLSLDRETMLQLRLSSAIGEEVIVSGAAPIIDGELQELPDGTGIIGGTFKSNVPVDKVELKLPGTSGFGLEGKSLPEGWKEESSQDGLKISGPPRLEIPARFKTGAWNQQLEQFFSKPVEFKFGLGKLNYGVFKFDFKTTKPAKPVSPNDAAEIPETVRYGNLFLITPKKDFTDGTWRLGIGDKSYPEYRDTEPLYIEDAMLSTTKELRSVSSDYPGRGSGRVFNLSDAPPGPLADIKPTFTYQNQFGETRVSGEANTKLLPPLIMSGFAPPPVLFNCTRQIFQGHKLCVCGFFPTLFSQNQLLDDGKRLNAPRAGSTDMVVFLPENLAPGKHVISWDVSAFDNSFNPEPRRLKPSATERIEFVVLAVQASIDQEKLRSGDRTEMRLRIIGTDEKLPIELENTTPTVIELQGGIKQVINTSGGSNNTLTRWVKAQHTGSPQAIPFNINYRLTLPACPCNPDETERAQKVGGNVSKPPDDAPGGQPKEPRKDCELILAQYNALSVEYAKLKTDEKRVLDGCDKFDDGTIAGRNNRDYCRTAVGLGYARELNRAAQLRKQMLDLLAAYRECRGGN